MSEEFRDKVNALELYLIMCNVPFTKTETGYIGYTRTYSKITYTLDNADKSITCYMNTQLFRLKGVSSSKRNISNLPDLINILEIE